MATSTSGSTSTSSLAGTARALVSDLCTRLNIDRLADICGWTFDIQYLIIGPRGVTESQDATCNISSRLRFPASQPASQPYPQAHIRIHAALHPPGCTILKPGRLPFGHGGHGFRHLPSPGTASCPPRILDSFTSIQCISAASSPLACDPAIERTLQRAFISLRTGMRHARGEGCQELCPLSPLLSSFRACLLASFLPPRISDDQHAPCAMRAVLGTRTGTLSRSSSDVLQLDWLPFPLRRPDFDSEANSGTGWALRSYL
ncbi:hypothetical protein EVG20_g8858, partial [Dentipellis fragilis]